MLSVPGENSVERSDMAVFTISVIIFAMLHFCQKTDMQIP